MRGNRPNGHIDLLEDNFHAIGAQLANLQRLAIVVAHPLRQTDHIIDHAAIGPVTHRQDFVTHPFIIKMRRASIAHGLGQRPMQLFHPPQNISRIGSAGQPIHARTWLALTTGSALLALAGCSGGGASGEAGTSAAAAAADQGSSSAPMVYAQADANLQNAQEKYDRTKKLYDAGSLTKQDLY